MHLLSGQRQQYLACATVLTEARENHADCFLHSQVRIETQTDLAMPDVADRDGDTQLAALGLAVLGVEHPRTDHGEFELADAAFHAEQQAIVRTTRVLHTLDVDYSRLDQTTQLEQMMPVSTVARQPRSIQAQHCADISSADGSDEPLEARSVYRATRRTPEIVVNYINVDEAMPPCHFN